MNFLMAAYTAEMSADLSCHRCGYDLRAHPPDGKCPECEASVAESRRLAAIPRRPAWRDSDPRWRRRMLAGAWVLVLLPLMDALHEFGWADKIRVPAVFESEGSFHALADTFLFSPWVYPPLIFCIGVVLLFSKERGRRHGQLDWTRRWGIICSYVTFLLCAAPILWMTALYGNGIAAIFLSMPPKYQPGMTQFLVDVCWRYLRYCPCPKPISDVVVVAFSSTAILLACVPLFDALRSSGPKRLAALLPAPLALLSLMHLVQVGWGCLHFSGVAPADIARYEVYFCPDVMMVAGLPANPMAWGSGLSIFLAEAAKWCIVLAIAVWLSIAQFAAGWRRTVTSERPSTVREEK
jgi:hypothetical protein